MTEDVSTGIGATLRDARENQGRSLEDVAGALRARAGQLQALEDERFDTFGGDVYAKGFLKSYASELGLDPSPLLETYRREVAHDDPRTATLVSSDVSAQSKPPRATPPAWIAWVLVVVVVLAGVTVLSTVGGDRSPEQAVPREDVGSPPPSSAEGADDPDVGEADDGPADDDSGDDESNEDDEADDDGDGNGDADEAEDADPDSVNVVVALEESSWMRVMIDGSLYLEEIVPAGETLPFEGEQEVEIRFGNAGGVIAELNGEDLGVQGNRGEVVTVRFTPDGSEQV